VEELKLAPFVVRRESERWVFVPGTSFAGWASGMFAAGSAFMVYLSTMFFRGIDTASAFPWIGLILLAVATYSAGLAIWTWRTRRTPLTVEQGGRVSYGRRELCAAGTVRAVRITDARGGDAGECEVGLEVAGGKAVFLPQPYFTRFSARQLARPFAAKLAEALQVQVIEPD
jgi:hypothetical protein